jgi:hypothetical protein
MITGDPGSVETFPLNGARWHTAPTEIAVRVAENRRNRFVAELYHFGSDNRPLAVSLLTLEPRRYAWTLFDAGSHSLETGSLHVSEGNRQLQFTLPPGIGCRLRIQPVP